jgi:predicted GH43/DUF377 family glycosyl hydrolase
MQQASAHRIGVLSPEIWPVETIPGFELAAFDRVSFERDGEAARRKVFSPFVWREDDRFYAIARAVPRDGNGDDGGSELIYARGDGRWFRAETRPVVVPGNEDDAGGCEDATLVRDAGEYIVFYTGVTRDHEMSRLLYASGADPQHLRKRGRISIAPSCGYCKEVSVLQTGGTRYFYFERQIDDKSAMSVAEQGQAVDEWRDRRDIAEARPGMWDCAHVSTGPILERDGFAWMFYNGCDDRGRWRIGLLTLDSGTGNIVERSKQPLFDRALPSGNQPDIMFANSVLEVDGEIWLYGTLGDESSFRLRLTPPNLVR